jgi:hypothetical protein
MLSQVELGKTEAGFVCTPHMGEDAHVKDRLGELARRQQGFGHHRALHILRKIADYFGQNLVVTFEPKELARTGR